MPEFGAGRLIVEGGAKNGAVYALDRPVTTIGRDEENDIVLADVYASRKHVEVRWDGEQYLLRDLGSRNGTLVNGRRVEQPLALLNGDLLTLGEVTLVFRWTGETLALNRPELSTDSIRVNRSTAEVWVEESAVRVTAKEFAALALLADRAGALVSKDELAREVWPEYEGAVGDYNLEQLISRLRKKVEPEPGHPRYLITVRGLGYRLLGTHQPQ